MKTYKNRLFLALSVILLIAIIFFVGKCNGYYKIKEAQRIDSVRSDLNKKILKKEQELRESEKQIKLFKNEKEEILKRETKLKAEIAKTKRIKDYAPKYVPCDTIKAVTEVSYIELKKEAETVEAQRDSATVLLDETNKMIAKTEEAENAEDIAQEGLLNEKDNQIALDKKEAKKSKRKAFWNGVKTSLVVAVFVVAMVVF